MGWMCITSGCKVTDGDWNNEGFAVFSIGDEMIQLHQKFFDFLASLTPTFILFFILLFIIVFMIALFLSVRFAVIEGVKQ